MTREILMEWPGMGKKTSYFKMFSMGILVVLPNILSGMGECFSSIALPEMKLSTGMSALFASVEGYTGFIGILLLGYLIDACGRKTTLLLALVPHIIGWALMYSSYSEFIIILGRALTGLTTIPMFYPPQLYAVECLTVNHQRLRSIFRTWSGLANSLGSIITFASSAFLSYQLVGALAAIISLILFVLILMIIPESPTWLYMKGRYGDAELSERKLGISQPILQTMPDSSNVPAPRILNFSRSGLREEVKKLVRPDVYTPVIIMTIVCILMFQTGGNVMTSYMLDIIGTNPSDVADSANLAHIYSIISGFLILMAHLFLCMTLPYTGNKKLSITMSFFVCIGQITLAMTTNDDLTTNSYGLHLMAVWLVTFSFHFGVLSASLCVISDLFPVDAKGFACIPILMVSLSGAFTVQMYPYLLQCLAGKVYYVYAVFSIIYAVFVFFFMPETVGRTYEQVRNSMFRSPSSHS